MAKNDGKGLIYRMKGAFAACYESGDSIVNAGWVEKKTTARMKIIDLTFYRIALDQPRGRAM